jgi:hypothetical protein
MNLLQPSPTTNVSLVFVNLGLMAIMCIIEVLRFGVEYRFRKDMNNKPDVLK